MASTRFMPLKLIIRILSPLCVFILLFPFNSVIAQQFVIQVAASKTPMDIQKFSKKYNISESITEVKYEDWYRYFIGNFVDLRSASKFAGEVALRSGITGVFPRKIAQRFVIQVAASKTPLDIQDFSKKHNISEAITEVKYEDWYRYFIGNFVDLRSASKSAGEIALKSGITGVFPRKLEEKSESYVQEPMEVPAKLVEKPSALTAPKDSGLIINQKPGRKYNELFIRILGNKNFVKKAFNYPIILLFIFLTIVFVLNILMTLLILQFSSRQKNLKERYIGIFKGLYEEVLRSYLFGEITWEETLFKLKEYKKPLNRKILTSVLLNFRENLRGEMDNSIPEIFVRLGLHKDALKSTKSMFYANKVRGIRELTNLYPQGTEEIIQNYINNPHELVRAEAQISYIRLHPEKPFDFLRRLTSPFTRWTQLSAFYVFRLHQLPVPSFIDYLDSENPNVRNFCLRMIIFFQQLENASEIIKMLGSQMELTRFLSIRAINDLRLYQGKELIKKRYPDETEKNRMEIIKALRNIGNTEDFDFLETIIKSGSVTAKTEACRSLYFMSPESRERLNLLNQNADLKIEQYLAHVTDQRN